MQSQTHVLIIGGGIAGPALALFLKKAGHTATIFEAYPAMADIGGGLMIAPNGMNVLAELGLAEAVILEGTVCNRFVFRDHHGAKANEMKLPVVGQPAISVSRTILHRILLNEAQRQGIEIVYGKKLRDLRQTQDDIMAIFADGSEARGDLLIGADGVNSQTRRLLFPDGPKPQYTGLSGIGGTVPRSVVEAFCEDDAMTFCFGPGSFMGCCFVGRQEMGGGMWWSNIERDQPLSNIEREAFTRDAVCAAALRPEWFADARRMIEASTETMTINIFDVGHLPQWSQFRAALVGDAAHAVAPHSGQGVSLALEDCIVLAKCLRDEAGFGAAFRRFEALRKPRVEHIVRMGRRMGEMKKDKSAFANWLQAKLMPVFFFFARFGQGRIFGYRVRWQD